MDRLFGWISDKLLGRIDRRLRNVENLLALLVRDMDEFKAALDLLGTQIEELGITLSAEIGQIADALNKPDPNLTEATLTLVALAEKVKVQTAAIANIIPDAPPVEEEPEEEEPEEDGEDTEEEPEEDPDEVAPF